ncbi:hypothetical protein [Salinigranum sp.]|uniref:hypothetical protein n=1 Tax=Salinigranum sp. TaxID=1966351 RepID=UPI0035635625
MSEAGKDESPQSFIVTDSMNNHGAITVQSTDSHATYHVVDYADAEARERLASLTEGAQVRMSVTRAGVRANVWTATKVVTGSAKPTPVRA